jgi:hypothetical protein
MLHPQQNDEQSASAWRQQRQFAVQPLSSQWGRNGRADALLVAVEKGVTMTQLEEEKTSGSGAAAMDMKLEVVVIAVSDIDH